MNPILYVGCPAAERAETEKLLAAADVTVVWAESMAYVVHELQRRDMPVLLDLSRGAAALQIARDLRTERASTLMFAVVDSRRPDLTTEAVLAGIADVFVRPLGGRRVATAIERERAYGSRRVDAASDAALDGELYAHSPAMREVMTMIARAATMRAGVLIRGEEGSGRQVAARTIHRVSGADDSRFVPVDCRAFDADGLETALFGTGPHPEADHGRALEQIGSAGLLHAALGGTIYLQHIEEAPSRVQARLARLLRDREAVLSDSNEAVVFDVRPMAGAEPGIEIAVQVGQIRDDLFRRVSVIGIDMPPLRNRREDIPAIANYFLRNICAAQRLTPKTFSRSGLALLAALPWRGNGPELEALLTLVVGKLPHGGSSIALEDILLNVRLDGGPATVSAGGTLKQARARFEREYIAAVLEQHRGRISDAAKALGIQRTNLYRKLRSLRVSRGRRT
jgi:DNA-binding NtrC family response regulator